MSLIHHEIIRRFDYDSETGIVTRKITTSANAKAGEVVGWINGEGYLNVKIGRAAYKIHRIVWLLYYGAWPNGVIDHINRNKRDNRISNLRDTTIQVNNINRDIRKNNKTGIQNVSWRERDKAFYASCCRNGKQNYLGRFKDAHSALLAVEKFKAAIGETM